MQAVESFDEMLSSSETAVAIMTTMPLETTTANEKWTMEVEVVAMKI